MGRVAAKTRVVRRSSPIPAAILPRQLAVAGAMTKASTAWAREICSSGSASGPKSASANRFSGKGLKCQGRDKLLGALSHYHLNLGPRTHQQSQQFHCLIGGNATGNAQNNFFALKYSRHWVTGFQRLINGAWHRPPFC